MTPIYKQAVGNWNLVAENRDARMAREDQRPCFRIEARSDTAESITVTNGVDIPPSVDAICISDKSNWGSLIDFYFISVKKSIYHISGMSDYLV